MLNPFNTDKEKCVSKSSYDINLGRSAKNRFLAVSYNLAWSQSIAGVNVYENEWQFVSELNKTQGTPIDIINGWAMRLERQQESCLHDTTDIQKMKMITTVITKETFCHESHQVL